MTVSVLGEVRVRVRSGETDVHDGSYRGRWCPEAGEGADVRQGAIILRRPDQVSMGPFTPVGSRRFCRAMRPTSRIRCERPIIENYAGDGASRQDAVSAGYVRRLSGR